MPQTTRRMFLSFIAASTITACSAAPEVSPTPPQRPALPLHPNETPDLRRKINHWADFYDLPRPLVHRLAIRESTHNPRARNGPYYESFVGGPLALLKTGDIVRMDLEARTLDMLVDEDELAARRAAWKAPEPRFERGWGYMFQRHVGQADQGCDFDYLTAAFGQTAGEPDIF